MKQRLIAILFLFIFIAPVGVFYLYIQFEKLTLKRERIEKLAIGKGVNEIVFLKFSNQETETKLRWKHPKEFEYDGQMYDVISKEIIGDSIIYKCWWDHEETKLNKRLKKLVASAFNRKDANRKTQKQLQIYLTSFFCTKLLDWQPLLTNNLKLSCQNKLYIIAVNSLGISPPTPPPKVS